MASWLSPGGSLLKSLESVLEKVDSTAASTLQKPVVPSTANTNPSAELSSPNAPNTNSTFENNRNEELTKNINPTNNNYSSIGTTTTNGNGNTNGYPRTASTPVKPSTRLSTPSRSSSTLKDDDIFDFLNTPAKDERSKATIPKVPSSNNIYGNYSALATPETRNNADADPVFNKSIRENSNSNNNSNSNSTGKPATGDTLPRIQSAPNISSLNENARANHEPATEESPTIENNSNISNNTSTSSMNNNQSNEKIDIQPKSKERDKLLSLNPDMQLENKLYPSLLPNIIIIVIA